MKRTQIFLPERQIALLRKEAVKKRTTVSGIIRTILEDRLELARRRKREKPHETLLAFADRIKKMGFRGPKDLASNLDEYLYG